jgi:hypothetical protein
MPAGATSLKSMRSALITQKFDACLFLNQAHSTRETVGVSRLELYDRWTPITP